MPFENTLFQPELIDAMHAAFILACIRVRLRPDREKATPSPRGSWISPRPACMTRRCWLRSRCWARATRPTDIARWCGAARPRRPDPPRASLVEQVLEVDRLRRSTYVGSLAPNAPPK